ncbi:MAG: hypothetical protein K1X81_02125 [Bacteroidia bacterium]|nr:hypothetical protein [Bacteroidia bacterium]
MKKILLFIILFGLCHTGFAQQDFYFPENFLNDTLTARIVDSITDDPIVMIDSVFKLIHKDSVDTDILIEKSLVNAAYMDFKGDSIHDDTCDYGTLLQLYGALYWGSTDTNQRLPYVTDYDSIAQLYRDSGYVPIGIVLCRTTKPNRMLLRIVC